MSVETHVQIWTWHYTAVHVHSIYLILQWNTYVRAYHEDVFEGAAAARVSRRRQGGGGTGDRGGGAGRRKSAHIHPLERAWAVQGVQGGDDAWWQERAHGASQGGGSGRRTGHPRSRERAAMQDGGGVQRAGATCGGGGMQKAGAVCTRRCAHGRGSVQRAGDGVQRAGGGVQRAGGGVQRAGGGVQRAGVACRGTGDFHTVVEGSGSAGQERAHARSIACARQRRREVPKASSRTLIGACAGRWRRRGALRKSPCTLIGACTGRWKAAERRKKSLCTLMGACGGRRWVACDAENRPVRSERAGYGTAGGGLQRVQGRRAGGAEGAGGVQMVASRRPST
ncbi:hypothetical protein GGX14DRAFT_388633 [Mycena pura]|uniref:Uncharacterized protein n=1 Tax=Mycena pura TaxID=153505 RepID=A0AAD6VSJ7_9AGAR|nr:hypothetical protein GGX14DRAFT_388633 [Mycena pura]